MADTVEKTVHQPKRLMGESRHTLDQKNRLAIPVKMREWLGETFVLCVAKNGDPCLFGYREEDWQNLMDDLQERYSGYELTLNQRIMHMNAVMVDPDGKGRITLPMRFIEQVGIESEVVVLGAGRRIEIWDVNTWEEMVRKYTHSELTNPIHMQF